MQPIILNIKGIKCDNPNCDYQDDLVEFHDYKTWLNKPCPQCGANLLTKADLKTVKIMIGLTNLINCILRPFIKPDKNAKRMSVIAEMNGTGQVNFKPKD